MLPVRPLNGEQILLSVNADNARVFAALDTQRLAASGVAHDVAGFVLRRPLPSALSSPGAAQAGELVL
jgi:hypothetical protein